MLLWAYTTSQVFSWTLSIYGFFIPFITQESKTCVLLKTFLEMISLLGQTIFLTRIADMETSFLNSLVLSSCIRDTCAKIACFAKNTCVKGAGIKDTDNNNIYAGDACTRVIGNVNTENTCMENVDIWDTLNGAVKYLGIHLELSRVLKVKLFGNRLKI